MQFCKTCLFQEINPIPISFNHNGICTGCLYNLKKNNVDWEKRELKFIQLIDEYKSKSKYDCIIPVSGGKDSYFAAHIAKKYNLNALLITYYSKRYLEEGDYNLNRMKDIFKFDAINITLGLKYLRVSPDHGTAKNLIGKDKADFTSLLKCINFVNKFGR